MTEWLMADVCIPRLALYCFTFVVMERIVSAIRRKP